MDDNKQKKINVTAKKVVEQYDNFRAMIELALSHDYVGEQDDDYVEITKPLGDFLFDIILDIDRLYPNTFDQVTLQKAKETHQEFMDNDIFFPDAPTIKLKGE